MRRLIDLGLAVTAALAFGLAVFAPATSAQETVSFNATASANGAAVQLTLSDFPIQDRPVDGGGPIAQAALSSFGTSNSFASFPYPGDLVISLPGLIAGLASVGAGGLPPTELPQLPPYPFVASADSVSQRDAEIGSGAYELRAHADPELATSSASAGLALPTGNTALVRSKTDIHSTTSGGVSASAETVVEGLSVGPLVIGQIKSTATVTSDAAGFIERRTDIRLSAVSIGGVSVEIRPDGISAGGPMVPIPIADTLDALLSASGIKVAFVPAADTPAGVIGQALKLTMPVDASEFGVGRGDLTVLLGSVSVDLAVGSTDVGTDTGPGGDPGSGGDTGSGVLLDGGTTGGIDLGGESLPDVGSSPQISVPAAAGGGQQISQPGLLPVAARGFDLRSIYLMFGMLSVAVLMMSQFLRILGVRLPWASVAG